MSDTKDTGIVRARIVVSGRVQGVGYRAFAVRTATQRGLVGGVRNLDDGRVKLEAEGPKDSIHALIEDLKVGPPASRIKSIELEWIKATERDEGFHIWY
ncbi:acylphosphatase [Petrachloros mirabilis]